MKKVLNTKGGITLIALVITIIVLLILAGVTVATLTGENGLLSKATLARQKNQESEQDENDKLSSYENELSNYTANVRNGLTELQIRSIVQDELQKSLNNISLDYENKVDIKGYNSSSNKYTVPSTGIVTTTSNVSSSGRMNTIHINDKWYYTAGGVSSNFVNGAAYSQFVSNGDQIYFVTDGNVSYTPITAYFIPFKYEIPNNE